MASLKIGVAWWKRDRNDQDYLSILLDPPCGLVIQPGLRAALFPNPNKTEERHPDYELVILPTRQADTQTDDFSPEQQPRSYQPEAPRGTQRYQQPEDVPPPPVRQAAPMAPRSAAPAPRQAVASELRQAAPAPQRQPARPAQQRQQRPANPPGYEEELQDPFAE